jgi:hypothetical protein
MPNAKKPKHIVGYEDADLAVRMGCVLELPDGMLSISPLCGGQKCVHMNDREYNSKEIYLLFENNPHLKTEWKNLWDHFKWYRDEKQIPEPYHEEREWFFKSVI